MRILITGGNGSLGRELVPALLARNHQVTVLDQRVDALRSIHDERLALVEGVVEDQAALEIAMGGADVVIHMAWSFADDPGTLLHHDLSGHQLLLETARRHGVRHVVYTSTAAVYGKPARLPIDEEHPLRVLEARKPAYGVAKEFAEKLTILAHRSGGPPATILRFWWAFGEIVSGRHLRDMLHAASSGASLSVPAECGGSFLTMEDFGAAIAALLLDERSFGETFNLASAYVTWEDVASMAIAATGASSGVEIVSPSAWKGPAFLADVWQLDDRRIRERLGFAPRHDVAAVRSMLKRAIRKTWERMSRSAAAEP